MFVFVVRAIARFQRPRMRPDAGATASGRGRALARLARESLCAALCPAKQSRRRRAAGPTLVWSRPTPRAGAGPFN